MEGDSPPLWAQSTAAFLPDHRRRSSAPILNPVVLILLIPTLFLLLMFFLLPPFLSHTSQFLRAGSVKKSWDSFNVLLVVCAILCGVFARRNDAGSPAADSHTNSEEAVLISNAGGKFHHSASDHQWFVQDRPSPMIRTPATGTGRLRRNSSSYPDLRHESLWEADESRFRFFDDFDLNHYRAPGPLAPAPATSRHLPARRTSGSGDRDDFLVKEIPVDSFVVHSTGTAARPPSPPTPRPKSPENQPRAANPVQRRTFHSVPREEEIRVEQDQFEFKIQTTIPDQPPSPLVTEEAIANRTQGRKLKRSDRKKSGSAKEIATAIATSLYSQRKRKRTRTRNIYDNANASASQQAEEQPTPPPQITAPPPPPPPPPPSFFQNIFKKGSKTKRVHSVSVSTPPPPPPPPPRSLFNNLLKSGGKSKRFQSASTSPNSGPPPPPPPPPSSIFNNIFKSNTKSKRFPSISTPPPPPPPPPSSTFRNMFKTGIKNKRFDPISKYPPPPSSDQSFEESRYSHPQSPPPFSDSPRRRTASAGRPPLPTKMNQYYDGNETINSGAQSPLIRIPSPPPLPPFKIPEMKFFARGDFVRIRSTHSSRCSSPGLDDVDFLQSRSSDATDGGDIQGSITTTCPSPDVNLKADSFIARLRGEWKIELMNSVNERRKMGQQP